MENTEVKDVRLNIGGMTCINCQTKIERGLLKLSGVKDAKVSWEKGEAEVTYDEKAISLKEICSEIEKLCYRIHNGSLASRIGQALFFAAVIALIFFILQKTGVMNLLVPSSLASSKMGYGLLFVTGLLTSVHCLAMCGAFCF
ncbi:heavy-metal-associated domain-containing protein [Treponema sp.]|uniref:heavy-metal-associated domain-containing protein n=1 Tax=Treponema sp. TaxID=166 RepID=UPI0025F12CD1|nr:cation transporter [Treponema sp.]MBR4322154.1 cation transporter [Treponema sp.]